MIVYGMSEKEMTQEVMSDMFNAFRYEDRNQNKFRRQVLKSSVFPVYRHIIYTSPRKNRWLILIEARSKKEVGDLCRITYVTTHQTPHGVYAIMVSWVQGQPQLIFFPPHFFSRFRTRMGLNEYGMDLLIYFFRRNSSFVYEQQVRELTCDQYVTEIYGSTRDGVALGVATVEGNILFKTFVTYDMLKGEQIEKFTKNEELRIEIHDK
jgi:hypothetical protein